MKEFLPIDSAPRDVMQPVLAWREGWPRTPSYRRSMYTPEERAQRKTALEAAMLRTLAGLRIANEWRVKGVPATSRHEAVECPECKGKLHLSQSSFNGQQHDQKYRAHREQGRNRRKGLYCCPIRGQPSICHLVASNLP